MAVAGRVAIVPKGDYAPNKAYKRLDCVMYNGLTMYIAKKGVPVGTLPTDENYWMKSISTNSTGGLSKKIVEELPTTGIDESTIYLIRKITPGENDVYNEYMYIDGKWELIGNTAVDLSDYYTQEQINAKISTINTELEEKLTSTSDISNTVVETLDTTPSARTLPKAGDKIKTIIAKTIKYFNDLKTIAFTGNASDLQDLDTFLSTSLLATEAGKRALDEAVGKVLNDKIEAILAKQGTTDISTIGNGTITGAISTLNSDYNLLYQYVPDVTLYDNMTDYHTISGDFKEICNCDEIVIIPHINNQSNDMYQLYYRNVRKQSEIWTGLIEPFSIGTATIHEQKISVRINKTSIRLLMNNTYYNNWYIVGLDVYGK